MPRVNRYAQKRIHKRKLEEQYATKFNRYNVQLFRDESRRNADDRWWRKNKPRNGGWEYWRLYYLTGRRQFAKKYSDKRIRQKYRQMIHHYDPEDVTIPKGADYEKEYDYNWTIW